MAEIKNIPAIRFKGFIDEWQDNNWADTVDISTNMVDPRNGNYDELFHIGPGNIESFTGRIYDNVLKVKDSNLISGKFHFKTGDVIYGKINPQLAKYTIAPFEGLASADAYVLNTRNGLVQNYLYLILQSTSFFKYSVSVSSRTGMPKINRDELSVFNYFAPNEFEQTQIGSYFQHLDKLISLHQVKVNKLTNLKKAMLEKMFPKQGADVPEIRFKGFAGAWEEKALNDFGAATSGTSIESEFSVDGKYKVISIGSYSEYSTYTDQGIRAIESEKTTKRVLNKDDLAMVLNDKTLSGNIIGRVLKVEISGTYVYNQRTQRIEPNKEKYDATFLYQLLNAPLVRKKIFRNAQGNTQIYVNWSKVKELKYLIPKLQEQKKIGLYFQKLDKTITLHQTELEKLNNLKKACLEKMFV